LLDILDVYVADAVASPIKPITGDMWKKSFRRKWMPTLIPSLYPPYLLHYRDCKATSSLKLKRASAENIA